ncbi:cell division protein ZapA [Erythrobacter sp. BLCC-B19]|uniref:cell division protein ZapA n=1 Tax=Erythrobacter sp. BLCC-B19 TaxID=3025315 RepID=UPI002362025F|nr:cell division protein ZapA [Erythrobacter sp. BLCC-B19]WDA40820.1 cell division protein ZapA [Erythrobacter sp. BLCC-B19]
MSTVTLSIGPKTYTIACADGQEAHIRALGAMIADKYAQLGSARAPLEAQNLLFAGLFLADELAEARKRLAAEPEPAAPAEPDTSEIDSLREAVARLEAELAAVRSAAAAAPAAATPQFDLFGSGTPAAASEPDAEALAEQLEALAARAEASAAALEAALSNA